MTQRIAVFPADRHSLYEEHGYSAAIRSGDLLFVSGQVMRKSYFSVSIYLPFEKPLIRRLLYSRILQYTLAFQRVKINSINVVVIFTLLAI